MSRILSAITRNGRAAIVAALVAAVVIVLSRWWAFLPDWPLLIVFGIAVLVLVVMLVATLGAPRPAAFVVRPGVPAFSAPPGAAPVVMAVMFTLMAGREVGEWSTMSGPYLALLPTVVLPVLWVVVAALNVVVALRGVGPELRPQGLRWRAPAGSVEVPWEALAPGQPARPDLRSKTLPLSYARPDLVRRRGLVWSLRTDTVHSWFIADAIRYYVDHPEHRAAIGTPAEYDRLHRTLHGETAHPGSAPAA